MTWAWMQRVTRPKPHIIEIAALLSIVLVLLAGAVTIVMMLLGRLTFDLITSSIRTLDAHAGDFTMMHMGKTGF